MICKLIQSNKHIPLHPLGGCNKYKKKNDITRLGGQDYKDQTKPHPQSKQDDASNGMPYPDQYHRRQQRSTNSRRKPTGSRPKERKSYQMRKRNPKRNGVPTKLQPWLPAKAKETSMDVNHRNKEQQSHTGPHHNTRRTPNAVV